MDSERLPWIDVLRTIAIIAVVGFHVAYEFNPDSSLRTIGFFGVSLFFMISGFLFANRYPNLRSFDLRWLKKHWIKLASLYYPTLILIVILFWSGTMVQNVEDLLVHFAFLNSFFPQMTYSIISPAWFLVPLFALYILFPFLNRFVKDYPWLLGIISIITLLSRLQDGSLTSFSPLFFLSDFCFGILFAHNPKSPWLLAPLINGLGYPVMAITYPIFYVTAYLRFPKIIIIPTTIIGAHTFEIFLFHESVMKVALDKWHVWGFDRVYSLIILSLALVAVTILSKKIQNALLEKKISKATA